MNKKLLEVLRCEEVEEKVKDLYCELDKKRYSEGSFMGSGWGWKIIVDLDGNVDYMYNNLTSTRMDVWKGEAIEIACLPDNAEVSTDDMGDIEQILDDEELKKFQNYLANNFDLYKNFSEDDPDYETEKNDYIYYNTTWGEYLEFNEENFHKIEAETWECICDNYSYDKICDIYYETIIQLEEELAEAEELEKYKRKHY